MLFLAKQNDHIERKLTYLRGSKPESLKLLCTAPDVLRLSSSKGLKIGAQAKAPYPKTPGGPWPTLAAVYPMRFEDAIFSVHARALAVSPPPHVALCSVSNSSIATETANPQD